MSLILPAVIVFIVLIFGAAAIGHVLTDQTRCRHLGPVEVDMTGERITLRCCACGELIVGPPNRWRSGAKR